MNVLVTGASGFIGYAVICKLLENGHSVVATVRKKNFNFTDDIAQLLLDITQHIPPNIFTNIDCVIHTAARSHVMVDNSCNPLDQYLKINRDATLNLAKLASKNGVKRFVYLSSVKVNGEYTHSGFPFTPDDSFTTNDPYGVSKYEAEVGLLNFAVESEMEVVIIRPPLVYGPGVKANFASMVSWVRNRFPLPFALITNKRSLIAIDNLVSFILLCSDRSKSPKAGNQIFLISDGEDISTTSLLRKVAKAYGVKSRLFPVPVSFMRLIAKLFGKSYLADRLFCDLQVDSSKALELLGWKPVVTMDEQLRKMAMSDINLKK